MIISPIMKDQLNAGFFKRMKKPTIVGPGRLYYKPMIKIAVVYKTYIDAIIKYILTTWSSFRLSDRIIHSINLKKKAPVVNMLRYDTLILHLWRQGQHHCRLSIDINRLFVYATLDAVVGSLVLAPSPSPARRGWSVY